MDNKISDILEEYGLDKNESNIFLFLVGQNELTAYQIAKQLKINRSTCYEILERLIKKGFISRIEKTNRGFYSANDINSLLVKLKDKENILLSLKPQLEIMEKGQETKIKFMEDALSQKEFNLKIIDLAKQGGITFLYIISNGPSPMESANLFVENIIKQGINIKKRTTKADFRFITDIKFKKWELLGFYKKLGENRFLENIPTLTTTVIFNNHIAFLYTTDTPKVIEIKNKKVSEEMKAYFEIMWKIAKKA